ncbi:hypothetical protein ASC99_35830 [Kitasatospora sp. Root107]|nr:hypothetical protein ASC99_35830 [Kitasatospora sp. Root107]
MPTPLRRTLKVLILCGLGYGILWGGAALGMLAVSTWVGEDRPATSTVAGIHNFQQVDAHVWRGSAPGLDGYRALAAHGIHSVVDLRAENLTQDQLSLPEQAGLTVERLPVRDGQTPTAEQVNTFLQTVRTTDGPVFVHCGAGVGRTGSMAAAYLVRTGQADPQEAAMRTLAVGPPSIEQVYYMFQGTRDESPQPPTTVQLISRFLDAPRRISSYF